MEDIWTREEVVVVALAVVEDRSATGCLMPGGVLGRASVEELLDLAQQVAGELTDRLVSPGFVECLAPVDSAEAGGAAADAVAGVTLPQVQARVGRLCRVVEGAATAVAGHVARAFEDPRARNRWLGLPVGKTGYRSSADYVERTQQTPARQTRVREDRAAQHLPGPGDGAGAQGTKTGLSSVSGAFWEAAVDPAVVDTVTQALGAARAAGVTAGAPSELVERLVAEGETRLMDLARRGSPSEVRSACRRWRQRFDRALAAAGTEPPVAPAQLGRAARFVREENGLFLWNLHLTQGQHEVFKTVASAGSNPRSRANQRESAGRVDSDADRPGPPAPVEPVAVRQRREVDAVIGALQAALNLADQNRLPDAGGSRPQVLVTIDFRSLAAELAAHPDPPPPPEVPEKLRNHPPPEWLESPVVSAGAFSGPIDPRVIRAWACDADLIPVVLGAEGEVLDVGRAQRLFTPGMRKGIIARDRGCAAPGCDFPPSWCQIHHIRYWTRHQGPTSVENGVLLCAHHHSAVHQDQLTVHVRNGVPWFEDTSRTPAGPPPRGEQESGLTRNLHWHDPEDPPW